MKTIALIVTYNPDLPTLYKQINLTLDQVDEIIIVDNSSRNIKEFDSLVSDKKIYIIILEQNFGIGYAQNIGFQKAIELKASYILLLDQDSVPSSDLLLRLKNVIMADDLLACGPSYLDIRSERQSFFVIEQNNIPRRWYPNKGKLNPNESPVVSTAFLISSGTLIRASYLAQVGGMRSSYFIDHVDTEWCFRARNAGFRISGVPQAVMEHSLGDEVRRVWFFGWRQVSYHTPLRDYYMFRNTLLMLKDTHMSIIWKGHFIWRLIQFAVYFLTFAPLRTERFIKMSLGIMHGLKNIRGKLDINTNTCHAIPKTELDPACKK